MNDTSDTALHYNTLADLVPGGSPTSGDAMPALPRVLRDLGPLPHAALFLGVADDMLPVLLNLGDPVPGPVLITADSGSGKTRLLQLIARAAAVLHAPEELRFAVVAEQPQEWDDLSALPNCEGILSFGEPLTANYLGALVNWAHTNKHAREYVLLLIDGLEGLNADASLHQSLRWLLLRGPSRRIWPIVTLKATRASAVSQWLPSFRTRLCGHIASDRDLTPITGSSSASFDGLEAGTQFAMREGKLWLPFRVPQSESRGERSQDSAR